MLDRVPCHPIELEALMQSPGYNYLSAPLWLITALHLVTLTLHFIAMNFVVGGIVAVLWGKFRNRWEDPTVQTFLKLFPSGLAATITLGVAPLLFLTTRISSPGIRRRNCKRVVLANDNAVLIVTYYLLYAVSLRSGKSRVREGSC